MFNEGNMYQFNEYQYEIGSGGSFLDVPLIETENFGSLNQSIKQGNTICLGLCFFYLGKLFITMTQYQKIDEPIFVIFMLLMTLHDVISILHYLFVGVLTQFITNQDLANYNRTINILALNTSINQIIIQELVSHFRPFNGLLVLDLLEQKSFYFNCILLKIIYYVISVYAFIAVLIVRFDWPLCIQIYLVLIGLYWFIPTIMCFVWPFVMLWFIVLRQELHYQQNRNIIIKLFDQLKNIKFKKLKENRPSIISNDCPICYQEVNESHSVIQLPCHKQHYFHADCCRQWLATDPRCPLCRFGLEQPRDLTIFEFM